MKLNLYPLFLIILGVLLTLGLLFSCTAKKKTVERAKISDTLISSSITYKTEPIKSEYLIDLECDTITGKVKPINFEETSGDNSASLKIENNQLKALLEVAESESKTDTVYISKNKDKLKVKEVVRYKTPFWHWWAHGFALLLIVFLLRKSLKRLFVNFV